MPLAFAIIATYNGQILLEIIEQLQIAFAHHLVGW